MTVSMSTVIHKDHIVYRYPYLAFDINLTREGRSYWDHIFSIIAYRNDSEMIDFSRVSLTR